MSRDWVLSELELVRLHAALALKQQWDPEEVEAAVTELLDLRRLFRRVYYAMPEMRDAVELQGELDRFAGAFGLMPMDKGTIH